MPEEGKQSVAKSLFPWIEQVQQAVPIVTKPWGLRNVGVRVLEQ